MVIKVNAISHSVSLSKNISYDRKTMECGKVANFLFYLDLLAYKFMIIWVWFYWIRQISLD